MKLSKTLISTISELEARAKFSLAFATRISNDCVLLPAWVTEQPAAYYVGQAEGIYSTIAAILTAHNKYDGFKELTRTATAYRDGAQSQPVTFTIQSFNI